MRLIDADKLPVQNITQWQTERDDAGRLVAYPINTKSVISFFDVERAEIIDAIPISYIQSKIEGLKGAMEYEVNELGETRGTCTYIYSALTYLILDWKRDSCEQ